MPLTRGYKVCTVPLNLTLITYPVNESKTDIKKLPHLLNLYPDDHGIAKKVVENFQAATKGTPTSAQRLEAYQNEHVESLGKLKDDLVSIIRETSEQSGAIAERANSIATDANTIASEAKDVSQRANDIAEGSNKLASDANNIALKADGRAKWSLMVSIISMLIALGAFILSWFRS